MFFADFAIMEESRLGIVIDFLREKNVDEEIINTFVREKVSSASLFLMLYEKTQIYAKHQMNRTRTCN